jgi:DNA or RNA helicases of superfamily II
LRFLCREKHWNAYPNQWEILWSKPRLSQEFIEIKIREWGTAVEDLEAAEDDADREKPWKKNRGFSRADVDGKGIDHFVYPHFTPIVAPRGVITKKMHPNEAYDIIRDNEVRDDLIISDIKECISVGRTPVVLSRYKEHSQKLYERLKDYADHVFLMTGNNSKKEHKKTLDRLHQVDIKETVILIATGSLIGEGFDFPRLDTLFMAMPVSFRSVVEQYAGRLNRDYEGKENVIVYDYVDSHIPMFDTMYAKRLKAYKQIGYEVCGGLKSEKQTANAIFDGENYYEVYRKDLLESGRNIVISSPAISGPKVYELISLLRDKQIAGVEVTIVTWEPDSYGFGDAGFWMQLHEEMRQAGFYIKTVEETCEHFAIIDQKIVWYGSMNLMAKSNIDDSMMRVQSKKIALELMSLTFGKKAKNDADNRA